LPVIIQKLAFSFIFKYYDKNTEKEKRRIDLKISHAREAECFLQLEEFTKLSIFDSLEVLILRFSPHFLPAEKNDWIDWLDEVLKKIIDNIPPSLKKIIVYKNGLTVNTKQLRQHSIILDIYDD